jgi:hypothetical protein
MIEKSFDSWGCDEDFLKAILMGLMTVEESAPAFFINRMLGQALVGFKPPCQPPSCGSDFNLAS